MDNFPAHIRETDMVKQTVPEHCYATAGYAQKSLQEIGLGNAAYLAGLLHDMGKMTQEFREYIQRAANGESVRRGSVNHTFAGCRYLLERYHGDFSKNINDFTSELLAYVIGAHHGQFDCIDENGQSGFNHRLQKEIAYVEAKDNFNSECEEQSEIDKRFKKATEEIEKAIIILRDMTITSKKKPESCNQEMCFYLGLLARLILSSVIEGDRRDTAEFMANLKYPISDADWQECLSFAEDKLSAFPINTPIDKARQTFSDQCALLGECETGVYRLNLPTGAGKTLSSLRAALSHAAKHRKKRIIFVMPLLSIIDQNAEIIRQFIKNPDMVLEHHSNVLREDTAKADELNTDELLTENWSAPVIITTLVQFLNTLFSGKSNCVRRFQALADSVIIIDEVQTVPIKLLSLFNLAITFLSKICNATVILCSATQPCLEETEHALFSATELVPFDQALWKVFERTRIVEGKACKLDELGEYIKSQLKGNLLLVCNTKKEAASVYNQLDGIERYHLSASMCMAHRQKTLQHITKALDEGRTFVCVATQVIEAGVDISFKQAIRIIAGMDSIIQTAGRCNRHGETTLAEVQIVRCVDENLNRLKEIKDAQDATLALLDAYRRNPGAFGDNLTSDASIRQYYKKLYGNQPCGTFDDCIKNKRTSVFKLLADNGDFIPDGYNGKYSLNQAFKTAGELFTVFDTETYDIVVPYEHGINLIAELETDRVRYDFQYKKELLEQLKPYTVSIYKYQKEELEKSGALYEPQKTGVLVLQESNYDEAALGLIMQPMELAFKEV